MAFAGFFQTKHTFATAAIAVGMTLSRPCLADVTLLKSDTWELTTTGRVDVFFSYGGGDANPVARQGELLPTGGSLQTNSDTIPSNSSSSQGTFESTRIRSGFVPNVLGVSLLRRMNDDTVLSAKIAIWATIETASQYKEAQVVADVREGYLKIESKKWGSVLGGRALDLFSRGATENDFLYGHGYGVGFPGNIDSIGPTNGMIGFGVLAAFFSPGVVYNTPDLSGFQLAVGAYDPSPLPGFYDATRWVRPESEITYDYSSGLFRLHLFGNGAYQRFYQAGSNASAAGYGGGYGARIEVGPVHLGLAGDYGKGLGLEYAFQAGDVAVSPSFELRNFSGYSALGQLVVGPFDLNGGWGISKVFALPSDQVPGVNVSLPQQWAISAGVVYHVTDYFHLDVDGMHALATWSLGERQTMNFLNSGMIVTW
jgi:hypothetical protein